jgi:ATP-dependent Clp protease ATP-binding subunit ClpA
MTEVKYETDLFGPRAPYKGHETGSPLNNFLAQNSGKRAIVMLDELEKSTQEVMNSLLIIFDEGRNNFSLPK